jgi:hypothetical protein
LSKASAEMRLGLGSLPARSLKKRTKLISLGVMVFCLEKRLEYYGGELRHIIKGMPVYLPGSTAYFNLVSLSFPAPLGDNASFEHRVSNHLLLLLRSVYHGGKGWWKIVTHTNTIYLSSSDLYLVYPATHLISRRYLGTKRDISRLISPVNYLIDMNACPALYRSSSTLIPQSSHP